MASKGVLSFVMLALLAAAATAQLCPTTRQNHTASLANASPRGCLKEVINATTAGDETLAAMIAPECFNKLNLQLVNNTGAKGCPDRTFTVAFSDQKKCAEGFDTIADGMLNNTRTAGLFNASGTFTTGTPFSGTLNSKNQMTVSVEGSNCVLTYSLKAVGKPTPVDAEADAAVAAETPAATRAPAAANATGASPAPAATPTRSAAATSSASALLAVLCAVLAFLL